MDVEGDAGRTGWVLVCAGVAELEHCFYGWDGVLEVFVDGDGLCVMLLLDG